MAKNLSKSGESVFTLEELDSQIIQSDSNNLPNAFVAAAVKINEEGVAYHAGIVIKRNDEYYLFHYTSTDVLLHPVPAGKWYFHRPLSCIPNNEEVVKAFIVHCKLISLQANPNYGFFYGGSYYDEAGAYFSDIDIPEIMTCVGFCLNVILGFIEADEYLSYKDWEVPPPEVIEKFFAEYIDKFHKSFPEKDLELFKANLRRILPSEFLAASFIQELPIRKTMINQFLDMLEVAIKNKRLLQASE